MRRKEKTKEILLILSISKKSMRPNTMRKLCKKWLENNEIKKEDILKPSSSKQQDLCFCWYYLEEKRSTLDIFKNLSSSSICWLENQEGVLGIGNEKAFYFKMYSKQTICAVVKMTEEESIIIEGDKAFPLVLGELETANKLYIFEDPLAMMHYIELHEQEKQNLYICTMGADTESLKETLDIILEHHHDISIVLAFTKNPIGDKEASKVLALLGTSPYRDMKLENPKNKELKEEVKQEKVVKKNIPSRGMGF